MYKIEAQPYCRQLKAELNQVGKKVEGLKNINGVAGSCVYFNSEASAQRPYLRILQRCSLLKNLDISSVVLVKTVSLNVRYKMIFTTFSC